MSRRSPARAAKKVSKKAAPKPAKKGKVKRKSVAAPRAPKSSPKKTGTQAATSSMARAVEELRFARKMLTDLINAIPEDKLCAQCTPADNHALWTMGHMASSYRWFSGLIGAKPSDVPQEYDTLFGYKSTPGPDASAYPSAAEIRRHFTDSFETFVRAAEALTDAQAAAPCASDSMGFAKDKLQAVDRAAWHEGWHAGQLSALRRALGLPPLMG